MKELFGKAINVLSHAIDLRTKRNTVLAANIANVDTPAYRAKDIPFKEIMAKYLAMPADSAASLNVTHSGHMAPGRAPSNRQDAFMVTTDSRHFVAGPGDSRSTEIIQSGERGTPNNVDLDQEMAKLAANNLQYQTAVQALIKELELLRIAITEGGKV